MMFRKRAFVITLTLFCIVIFQANAIREKISFLKCENEKPKSNETKMRELYHGKNVDEKKKGPFKDCYKFLNNLNPHGLRILNSSLECGISIKRPQIYAEANTVNIKEYPWVALLQYKTYEKHFQCSGVLISDRYVLTAASCVKNKELYGVRLGEQNIDTNPDCEIREGVQYCSSPVEDFGIDVIKKNSEYLGSASDVALIRLSRKVIFKENIRPICLPLMGDEVDLNINFFVSIGWGMTKEGFLSAILKRSHLNFRNLNDCKPFTKRVKYNDKLLCVEQGSKNSFIDPGAPLFYERRSKHFAHPQNLLYGIIPNPENSRIGKKSDKPFFVINIFKVLPWILNNVD